MRLSFREAVFDVSQEWLSAFPAQTRRTVAVPGLGQGYTRKGAENASGMAPVTQPSIRLSARRDGVGAAGIGCMRALGSGPAFKRSPSSHRSSLAHLTCRHRPVSPKPIHALSYRRPRSPRQLVLSSRRCSPHPWRHGTSSPAAARALLTVALGEAVHRRDRAGRASDRGAICRKRLWRHPRVD